MEREAARRVVTVTAAERRLALALELVARVIPAVAVAPLPGSSAPVLGTIDLHGEVIPAIDLRHHLGLALRPMALSDRMVIVETADGPVALCVDAVEGVMDAAALAGDADTTAVDDADAFLGAALAQLPQRPGEATP